VGIVTGLQQGIQNLENAVVSPSSSSSSNDEYDQNDSTFVVSQLLSSPVTRPLLSLYDSIVRQQQLGAAGLFSPAPLSSSNYIIRPPNRNPLYNFMYLRPNFRRIVYGSSTDDHQNSMNDDYDDHEAMETDAETDEK
jgi:hypothetical protein